MRDGPCGGAASPNLSHPLPVPVVVPHLIAIPDVNLHHVFGIPKVVDVADEPGSGVDARRGR